MSTSFADTNRMENPDLDALTAELDSEYTGTLPVEAIREAQRRREEVTPHLIELIGKATESIRGGIEPKGNGHFFALFLLAEFKAKQALPAIIESVTLPSEGPFDLYGDAVTEDLRRVLAVLAADRPEIVEELIANRSLNEFVRSAAAGAYLHWVRDGRWTREQAVERLRHHLREAIASGDAELAAGMVTELSAYSPREALDEIQEAYRRGLVDTSMIGIDDVEESIAEGETRFQQELGWCPPTEITDTVEELEAWSSYQDEPESDEWLDSDEDDDDWDDSWNETALPSTSLPWGPAEPTIRNTTPKVGRNEPCPCGSGKKYKKCCGAS